MGRLAFGYDDSAASCCIRKLKKVRQLASAKRMTRTRLKLVPAVSELRTLSQRVERLVETEETEEEKESKS